MSLETLEFTAPGTPRVVADAIEQCASGFGSIHAIVVPWESDRATLSMAITSVGGEGWAIEHTNLGTIKLTDVENDMTHVAITFHDPDHAEKQKMGALFAGFVRQIQSKLQVTPQ